RQRVRGVDLEFLRGRIVGGGGLEVAHVGSAAELAHREGAEDLAAGDLREEGAVMPFGAEQLHAPLEEPELHPELDGEREVVIRQRLEGGEEVERAPATTILRSDRE